MLLHIIIVEERIQALCNMKLIKNIHKKDTLKKLKKALKEGDRFYLLILKPDDHR